MGDSEPSEDAVKKALEEGQRLGSFYGYVPQMLLWHDTPGEGWPKEVNILDRRGISRWFILVPAETSK